jgi:hypothetical protein
MASFRKARFYRRRSLRAGGLTAGLLTALSLGCATSAPPPDDRLSPARLKSGPSMYETGRFGTVPLSSGGLKVDEGSIDGTPRARPARAATAERRHGKRQPRARAERR